jgi:uncharacterized protein (DUF302 family)
MDHQLTAELHCSFDEALKRATEALKTEGFGVLTEIDVRETLAQKLGVEIEHYKILGACNPSFAHAAIGLNPLAGLMMPCNVAVYESGPGRVMVATVNPRASAAALGDARLGELAANVYVKLASALALLRSDPRVDVHEPDGRVPAP